MDNYQILDIIDKITLLKKKYSCANIKSCKIVYDKSIET